MSVIRGVISGMMMMLMVLQLHTAPIRMRTVRLQTGARYGLISSRTRIRRDSQELRTINLSVDRRNVTCNFCVLRLFSYDVLSAQCNAGHRTDICVRMSGVRSVMQRGRCGDADGDRTKGHLLGAA